METLEKQTISEHLISGKTLAGTQFIYECSITYAFSDEDYTKKSEIIAETPSKARYRFYKGLDAEESYSDYFKYIKVRKIGVCDQNYTPKLSLNDLKLFHRVIEHRNIPFAEIGMKVSVDGKIGKIIGANSSMNLDVNFIGDGTRSNCHPTWAMKYFDKEGNIIAEYGE